MSITNTLIPNFNGNPDVNPQTSTFAPGTPTPGTYNIQATFTQPATGTFDSDGSYTIDLEIMNDMCVSTAIQQTVEVTLQVTLQESIGDVMCMPAGLGEMDITWDAVSCATEYIIFVDGVEVATQTGTII